MSLLRSSLALIIAALALLAVAGAAVGAPPQISAKAETAPGIAIDAAGTAHVVWGTSTGSGPYTYTLTYCKVPRGQSACASTQSLPVPSNRNLFGHAHIFLKDAQVLILHSICCGVPEGTYLWKSTNSGASFASAMKVMTEPAGYQPFRAAMNQTGLGALVNNVEGTRAGFAAFDGSTAGQSPALIGDGAILGAGGVGWLNATTPLVTQMGYLTNDWLTKVFASAATGYNTATNWNPATKIGSQFIESAVATGPAGTFVAARAAAGNAFGKEEIAVSRIDDTGGASAPTPVIDEATPAHSPAGMDFVQDAGGRLHLIWLDAGFDGKVYYQWSKDASVWSPPTLIQHEQFVGGKDLRLAIGADGGGWVVSGTSNDGPIVLAAIEPKGDASPPPRPKPASPSGPAPAPPPPACPKQVAVTSDAPAAVRSGPCFTKKGTAYSTTGAIRIGGVDLVPKGSGTITVDTGAGTVKSKGSAYEVRVGAVVLAREPINWNVNAPIAIDGLKQFGVRLFGLGVTGKADLWFTNGQARIQVNLALPSPLDAINANTVLRATMEQGLIVDGFAVEGRDVPIGPVLMSKFSLAYVAGADTLEGSFSMRLPPGASDNVIGGIGLANGAFKHAELEIGPGVPPLPLPLWATPPVTLQRIGASASNDAKGFSLAGKIGLVAGGEIAGTAVVGVDGSLRLFVPTSRAYAQIRAEGKVNVVGVPLGGGFVQIRSDGPLTFGGSMGIDFDVVEANFATAGGINLSNGDFYASGEASLAVDLAVLRGSLAASSIVSSLGLAACGEITGEVPVTGLKGSISVGYQKPWGKDSSLGACEIDKYVPASLKGGGASARLGGGLSPLRVARAAQIGGRQFTLAAGRLAGMKVVGVGGRAGFTLTGPGGRQLVVPAGLQGAAVGPGLSAVGVSADSVEVQVSNPSGSWALTPDPAGPAVAQVFSARALPVPKLRATVRRARGARRTVVVRASNLGSQALVVREVLPGGGANELGRVTKNGTSRLTFAPTDGPGGRRTIEAVVVSGSKVAGTVRVASYVAPAPQRLPAPRRVTVQRKRSGIAAATVRWRAVEGAASYRVLVRSPDGRKEYLTTKRGVTRLTVGRVTFDDKLTLSVQAMPRFGQPGVSARATSRAVKLRPVKRAR